MASAQLWTAEQIDELSQRKWRGLDSDLEHPSGWHAVAHCLTEHDPGRNLPAPRAASELGHNWANHPSEIQVEIPRAVRAAPIQDVGMPTRTPTCRTKSQR
jgi:hypothetical protein